MILWSGYIVFMDVPGAVAYSEYMFRCCCCCCKCWVESNCGSGCGFAQLKWYLASVRWCMHVSLTKNRPAHVERPSHGNVWLDDSHRPGFHLCNKWCPKRVEENVKEIPMNKVDWTKWTKSWVARIQRSTDGLGDYGDNNSRIKHDKAFRPQ